MLLDFYCVFFMRGMCVVHHSPGFWCIKMGLHTMGLQGTAPLGLATYRDVVPSPPGCLVRKQRVRKPLAEFRSPGRVVPSTLGCLVGEPQPQPGAGTPGKRRGGPGGEDLVHPVAHAHSAAVGRAGGSKAEIQPIGFH